MAKDHVAYYSVKWSAYATLGGTRLDIAGFQISFNLNEIPMATFFPAIGRGQTESDAIALLLATLPYTEVEIFVKGTTQMDSPQGSQTPGFPYNEFVKVFEGYYQGIGYKSERSPAGGSMKLFGTAAHWLTALTGTSSKTAVTAVKGPGGFAEVANIGGGPGLFDIKALVSTSPDSAEADIWTEFAKPFFRELADNPDIWGESFNGFALEALDKMDDELVFTGLADNSLVIPLKLAPNVPEEMLIEFYSKSIAVPLFIEWRESNLWTALGQIASQFTFRLVPLIETATCAPVFGALGGEPFITIGLDEYYASDIHANTPALITKWVLTGDVALAGSSYDTTPVVSTIIGIASAEDVWDSRVNGITVHEEAPAWLSNVSTIGKLTRESLGGAPGIIPDAVNPEANVQAAPYEYQAKFNNYLTSELGDRAAQARLFDAILKNRTGMIRGRFRLDVCPGSTIKVRVIDDKFGKSEEDPQHIYGLVDKVSLTMLAGTAGDLGYASTQFDLTHVRTAQEHEGFGGFLTSEEHPIFESKFVGAKLWSD